MAKWRWREDPIEHLALEGWPGLQAWMTGRRGGVSLPPFSTLNLSYRVRDLPSAVAENRRRAASPGGARPVVWGRLVHGAAVAYVDRNTAVAPVADALVTDDPGVVLAITAADCLPVFLADPESGWLGIAHAGWRGTVRQVARAAVAALADRGVAPGRLWAALGVGIGPCCYEVGRDVLDTVAAMDDAAEFVAWRDGRAYLDLWAWNEAQLVAAGVSPDRVAVAGICTACRLDRFFSHRRERRTGRMGGFLCRTTD
jgi:YfiH family protein